MFYYKVNLYLKLQRIFGRKNKNGFIIIGFNNLCIIYPANTQIILEITYESLISSP